MRLTWRDGITTVLAALVVLVTLAATQGWDWPCSAASGARSARSGAGVRDVLRGGDTEGVPVDERADTGP
jgi:hypothetical protein